MQERYITYRLTLEITCLNRNYFVSMGDSDDRLRENKPEVAFLSNINASSLAEIFQ